MSPICNVGFRTSTQPTKSKHLTRFDFIGAKPNKSIRRVFNQSLIKIFVTSIKTAVRQAHGPERSRRAEKRQKQTFKVNIGFLKSNEIKLRSEASSLFDVRCWMFDVRRSSFKTTLYGVNVPCECLQNKLALMALPPLHRSYGLMGQTKILLSPSVVPIAIGPRHAWA